MRGDTKAITSLVLREESAWSLSAAVISSLSFLFTYLLLTSIMLLIIHDLIYASQNIITSLNKIQYILDCYIFQLLTYIPTFFKIMYGNWQQASLEVKHFPGKILRNLISSIYVWYTLSKSWTCLSFNYYFKEKETGRALSPGKGQLGTWQSQPAQHPEIL